MASGMDAKEFNFWLSQLEDRGLVETFEDGAQDMVRLRVE
jgi:hypothetical protein